LRSSFSFIIHLSDFRPLGAILQRLPPGERGHPEDVLFDVVVALFELGGNGFEVFCAAFAAVVRGIEEVVALRSPELRLDLGLPHGERVGDVFEENQPEDGVFIDGCVEIRAEPVGGGPSVDQRLRAAPAGCLRQSVSLRSALVEVAEKLFGGKGSHAWRG